MSVKEQINEQSKQEYKEYLEPLKKLRKKGSKGTTIFMIICCVIGGLAGFFGAMLGDKLSLSGLEPFPVPDGFGFLYFVALFVFYLVTTVLHTIIHEGGHLVFGLLSGYEFLSFRVMSFTIVKKDGKLAVKKFKLLGTLGQCLMYPPEWKEGENYPYLAYNLGGGIFNIIFSILAIPLFFTGSSLLGWMAGIFIFTGAIFAISNLIPMTVGIPNDGKNALDCKRSPVAQKAFYLQLKLNTDLSDGIRLSDLPLDIIQIEMQEESEKSGLVVGLRLYEIYWYMEHGMDAEAKALLSEMEAKREHMALAFVNSFDLLRMYFLLLEETPVERLAAYYNVLKVVFQQNADLSVLFVKYAYYRLLTDEEREMIEWLSLTNKKGKLPKKLPKVKKPITAESIYEQIQKSAAAYPVVGEAQLYLELTERVKDSIISTACDTQEA
ncbi:MAG: hypothetical protein J6L65_02870 [Lachnospiraceae bacterium]|nr:hypothetical protein [Lachnospiraceae bacterium]